MLLVRPPTTPGLLLSHVMLLLLLLLLLLRLRLLLLPLTLILTLQDPRLSRRNRRRGKLVGGLRTGLGKGHRPGDRGRRGDGGGGVRASHPLEFLPHAHPRRCCILV